MQLPEGKGVLVENPEWLDEAEFVGLILKKFPQLKEEFEEEAGLLHLQMYAFSRFAQAAIEGGDLGTLKRCYHLLVEAMKRCSFEVEEHLRRIGEWQVEAQDNQQRAREERDRKLRRRS